MVISRRIGRHLGGVAVMLVAGALASDAQAQRQLVTNRGVDEKWCRAVATTYDKEYRRRSRT